VKEGFLLGNVIKVVTNTISDADINIIKHQIVYSTLFFWYRYRIQGLGLGPHI